MLGLRGLIAVMVLGFQGWAAEPTKVESFPLRVTSHASPGFSLMPSSQTGIIFSNSVVSFRSSPTLVTSGIAAGDVDGDGL